MRLPSQDDGELLDVDTAEDSSEENDASVPADAAGLPAATSPSPGLTPPPASTSPTLMVMGHSEHENVQLHQGMAMEESSFCCSTWSTEQAAIHSNQTHTLTK